MLREVTVKIRLKRINIQEVVEALLDSRTMGLVMSLEFARKQELKLKKIERPIYVRNVNSFFNKKGPIEHTVEMNIYYQGHKERMEIDMIRGQKWNVILGILQLACHNLDINQRTDKVKITRYLEEHGKQWRLKQGKLRWQKKRKRKRKKKKK